jgi:glycosyltransferase involved in cell wall biosynthesis
MRVLLTNIGWKPAVGLGGPVISVPGIADRLVARGHEVSVFTTDLGLDHLPEVPRDRPVMVDGVRVWYFRRVEPIRALRKSVPYLADSIGFGYAPMLRSALAREISSYDCVNTQSPFIYPALATARSAIRRGIPLFYHQRGNLLGTHLDRRAIKKRLFIEMFEKRVMRGATTLIALNEAERSAFAAWAPATICRVVPNGIDLPVREERAAVLSRVRVTLGIPESASVILFLGRIHPWKRVDVLLEAFLRVGSRHKDSVLVLAGEDQAGLGERWRTSVEVAGLGGRVRFTGAVAGQSKADLLARADLFCLPSLGEGFSMAALEAMSFGTPVIVTPECNLPEVASLGLGRISQGTPAAFEDAICSMLNDRAGLERASTASREFAERHSWEGVVDRLLDVYSEGIDRRRRGLRV